jgi:hypothetical protein
MAAMTVRYRTMTGIRVKQLISQPSASGLHPDTPRILIMDYELNLTSGSIGIAGTVI